MITLTYNSQPSIIYILHQIYQLEIVIGMIFHHPYLHIVPNIPVEIVTWDDLPQSMINILSQMYQLEIVIGMILHHPYLHIVRDI